MKRGHSQACLSMYPGWSGDEARSSFRCVLMSKMKQPPGDKCRRTAANTFFQSEKRLTWLIESKTQKITVRKEPVDHRCAALPSGGSNWNVKMFEHLNGSRYALSYDVMWSFYERNPSCADAIVCSEGSRSSKSMPDRAIFTSLSLRRKASCECYRDFATLMRWSGRRAARPAPRRRFRRVCSAA
jgi:hypothetical protein